MAHATRVLLTILVAGLVASALAAATPAGAQEERDRGDEGGNRMPLSRQTSPPEGDRLSQPASPVPAPAGAPHQEGIVSDRGEPATSAIVGTEDTPVIDEGDEGRPGFDVDVTRTTPDPDPVPRTRTGRGDPSDVPDTVAGTAAEPAQSFRDDIGPNAAGALEHGRAYAEDLVDYMVHLADKEEFGRVARLIVNLETGELEAVVVSTGGLLGVGDKRFEIPWRTVGAIDTGRRELRVAVREAEVTSQAEAFAVDSRD